MRLLLRLRAPRTPPGAVGAAWKPRSACIVGRAGQPRTIPIGTEPGLRRVGADRPLVSLPGVKANVLPQTATATVNHRLHPRDSVASVRARDERVIDDRRVKVEVVQATEPSPVSSVDHPAFASLRHAVHEVFPGAAVAPLVGNAVCPVGRRHPLCPPDGIEERSLSAQKLAPRSPPQASGRPKVRPRSTFTRQVAPGLFVAASDSKHFWGLAPQIYRFNPIALHVDDTKMFHGFNERIGVEAHARNVAFMRTFHVRSQARAATR